MAFDQPLEADSIDDNNFISMFVRGPIIGALTWLAGGRARNDEDCTEHETCEAMTSNSKDSDAKYIPQGTRNQAYEGYAATRNECTFTKKYPPSMTGSEISDLGIYRDSHQSMPAAEAQSALAKPGLSKVKKGLSWSDESGQSLVEYIGEESTNGEPGAPSIRIKRSAMTRTKSELKPSLLSEKSYLPKSIDMHHSGIPMPSHPSKGSNNSSNSSLGGGESPLWGWYTNLTPPTPEMYYSKPTARRSSSTCTSSTTSADSAPPMPISTNRVFMGLQEKNRDPALAFPAVPL